MEATKKFSIRRKKGKIDFQKKGNHIRQVALELATDSMGYYSIFDDDIPRTTIKDGDVHFYYCHLKLPKEFQNIKYAIEIHRNNNGEIIRVEITNQVIEPTIPNGEDKRLDMLVDLSGGGPLFGDMDRHPCKSVGILCAGGTSCPRPIVYDDNQKFKLFFYKGTYKPNDNRKKIELDHYMMPLLLQDNSVVFLAIAKDQIGKIEGYLKEYHEFKESDDPDKLMFFAVDGEHLWDDELDIDFTLEIDGVRIVKKIYGKITPEC